MAALKNTGQLMYNNDIQCPKQWDQVNRLFKKPTIVACRGYSINTKLLKLLKKPFLISENEGPWIKDEDPKQ